MKHFSLAALSAAMCAGVVWADPILEAATLPDARSVAIGDPATVFATVMNTGDSAATNCRPGTSYDDSSPTTLAYQTVDGSNALTGTANTPVDIPASGQQGFLLAVTASEAFSGTIPFVFECDNGTALGRPGINDLVLTVEAGSPPDLVTILATPSGDGILRIATAGGANAAGGAVINIGGGTANVTATPVLIGPEVNTQLRVDMCETNPATGACLAPRSASVDMNVDGSISTYTVFVRADPDFGVPLYPEYVRVSVEFRDQAAADDGNGQPLRGASSVAYTAPVSPFYQTPMPLAGSYAFRVRDEDNDPGGRFLGDGRLVFDEEGFGLGCLPTRFGDHVVRVNGSYDLEDPNRPTFSGTFEYLQYIVVNFNTATGQFNFVYENNSGFRGLYAFAPSETTAGIDAPASRSEYSDASRIVAQYSEARKCPAFGENEQSAGDFNVFVGDAPLPGQEPDFTMNIVGFDNDEDYYLGSDAMTTTSSNGNLSLVSEPGSIMRLRKYSSTDVWSLRGAMLQTDEQGSGLIIDRAFLTNCTEDGFTIVAVSGDRGFTMHFRRPEIVE